MRRGRRGAARRGVAEGLRPTPAQGGERGQRGGDGALSPSQYFKYEFPEGVDSVIVKVTSAVAFPCSVISIQDILVGLGGGASCPGDP